MNKMKRSGLSGSPCFTPIVSLKRVVLPLTDAVTPEYIAFKSRSQVWLMPGMRSSFSNRRRRSTESNAILKSTKHTYSGEVRYFLMSPCSTKALSRVPQPV